MLVDPGLCAVIMPAGSLAKRKSAMDVLLDPQVSEGSFVRFCVVLSEYIPVAVNWSFVPSAIDFFSAVTVIYCNVAVVMVRPEVPSMPSKVALMTVEPSLTPVASPLFVSLLIVASLVDELLQFATFVTSCVLSSLYTAVAKN